MNKKFLLRLVLIAVVFLLTLTLCLNTCAAQASYSQPGKPPATKSIPQNQRPWAGTPWLVGMVLTAGAVVVGLKNSKRTHLD